MLDSLARECGGKVSFGEEIQERIGDELLRHNIVAGEIVTEGEGESVSVALTVRASDAEKPVLPRIVSSCLGVTLERTAVSPRGDECVVHLAACSVFEVAGAQPLSPPQALLALGRDGQRRARRKIQQRRHLHGGEFLPRGL